MVRAFCEETITVSIEKTIIEYCTNNCNDVGWKYIEEVSANGWKR